MCIGNNIIVIIQVGLSLVSRSRYIYTIFESVANFIIIIVY